MSERDPRRSQREPSYLLGHGFSVLRLAVGDALDALATDLETVRENDAEFEVRHPNPSDLARRRGDRKPGVQIVAGKEIRGLNVPQRDVLMSEVYRRLDEDVPSLALPLEDVILTEAYDVEIFHGLFIVSGIDDASADALKAERAAIMRTAMGLGRVASRQRIYLPEPDVTLGFIGENAANTTLDDVYEVVDAHLPLTVTLQPAVRFPAVFPENS